MQQTINNNCTINGLNNRSTKYKVNMEQPNASVN